MTEKELIAQIKTLKEIKPSKEWSDFVLQRITDNAGRKTESMIFAGAQKKSFYWQGILNAMFQRKFAYSLALFAFVIVGILSFTQNTVPGDSLFLIKKLAEQSQSILAGKDELNQNIASLNNRVQDLAYISEKGRKDKDNVNSIVKEIKANAAALQNSLNKNKGNLNDRKEMKEIANTLKILSNVSEDDLAESKDLRDLYKTVVENQITDLKNSALTEEQEISLKEIENLYENGDYAQALEIILMINK